MSERADVPHAPVNPPLLKLVRFARRFFPAFSRAEIRALLFQWLDLRWDVATDLWARVSDRRDWIVYNEIFVRGEYDEPLGMALDSAAEDGSPIHILDIGANVGFFTLRAVEQLRRPRMSGRAFAITAVEASARCAREFRERIFYENGLSDQVTLVQGLVGERSGSAMFYEDSLFQRHGYPGVKVSYIDLSSLLTSVPRIDLLKCDIEGGELLFIENYPDVFQKIRVAVFELHPYLCDAERCRDLLRQYGFAHEKTFRASGDTALYAVWR